MEQQYRGQPLNPAQYREVASRVDERKQAELEQAERERLERIAAQSNGQAEIVEGNFNPGERPEAGALGMPESPQPPQAELQPTPEAGLVFAPEMVRQLKVAGFAVGGGVLVGIALAYVIKSARKVEGDSQGS